MNNNELTVQEEVNELIRKLERGEKLTDDEVNKVKYHQVEEERTALDKIVRGVNDVFIKDYKFEDYGGMELAVRIKAPNALEQGRINSVRENFVGGTGT